MTTDLAIATPRSKRANATAKATAKTAAAATPPANTGATDHLDRIPDTGPTHVTTSKLDQLTSVLSDPAGASIATMMAATGWQAHSVRGAMAGALKKRGLTISSAKVDGVRIYRAGAAA